MGLLVQGKVPRGARRGRAVGPPAQGRSWALPSISPVQFQGKWYVVGLAGNAVKKEEQGRFKMYTTTYELKEDGSYNVISTLLR